MNEKIKSIYGVFINKHTERKLVFYPCPKNANTSAKLFFLKHLGIANKFIFIGDKIPLYKQTKKDFKGKMNLIDFLPAKQPFSKLDAEVKCCIIRDPLDRFISSYKNRILYHKDIKFKNHSVDMILKKLEIGLFENKHFLPQHFFLGDDLSYYSFYTDITNIKVFEDKVNEFFGNKINFPEMQTGGKDFDVRLNNIQIERIRTIYAKDFEIFNQNF